MSVIPPGVTSDPAWWHESWSISDWVVTLFDQPVEVHTLVLGLLVGVVLGIVTVGLHRGVAALLAGAIVLFMLGATGSHSVCLEGFTACRHVQVKPWYFLGGLCTSLVLVMGILEPVSRSRRVAGRWPSTVTPVLAVVAVGVLAFVTTSVWVPTVAGSTTGVSTVGGLVGAGLAYATFARVRDVDADRVVEDVGSIGSREEFVHALSLGTIGGFALPGSVGAVRRSLGSAHVVLDPSMAAVPVAFVAGLVVSGLAIELRRRGGLSNARWLWASVAGVAVYVAGVLVAVILAGGMSG